MYQPVAFVETDLSALDALIVRDNFITLITMRDKEPTVSHLPVLYRREGEHIELCGHWARANPQAQHAGPALVLCHGPHAYVSPSWYPDKIAASRVPTWNYAVAHLHGSLHTFDDSASLATLVDELSVRHEAAIGSDWRFEHDNRVQAGMLRGIVGFRFNVERASLKFKLSQNHPQANRAAVATQLEMQSREASRGIAALMRMREPVL